MGLADASERSQGPVVSAPPSPSDDTHSLLFSKWHSVPSSAEQPPDLVYQQPQECPPSVSQWELSFFFHTFEKNGFSLAEKRGDAGAHTRAPLANDIVSYLY